MPVSVTLPASSTLQYTAIGFYSDGSTANLTSSVTWSSTNSSTPITNTGLATVGGDTIIQATFNSLTSNSSVLTVNNPIFSIAVTPTTATIVAGTTQQYTAIATYTDHSTAPVTSSVTWSSSSTPTATIVAGGLATGVNSGSTNITATLGSLTSDTATLNVSHFIYASPSFGSSMRFAPLSATGAIGSLSTTASSGNNTGISANPAHTYLYLTRTGSGEYSSSSCKINSNGTLTNCVDYYQLSSSGAYQNTVNPAGTYLYIANATANSISYCPLSANGVFGSCQTFPLANSPQDIKINPVSNLAYITTLSDNSVKSCQLNSLTGRPQNCSTAGTGFTGPALMTISSSGNYLFVAGSSSGTPLRFCTISSDGSLSGCRNINMSALQFNSPYNIMGISLNASNDRLYLSSNSGGGLAVCSFNSTNGDLTSCSVTSTSVATGLAVV